MNEKALSVNLYFRMNSIMIFIKLMLKWRLMQMLILTYCLRSIRVAITVKKNTVIIKKPYSRAVKDTFYKYVQNETTAICILCISSGEFCYQINRSCCPGFWHDTGPVVYLNPRTKNKCITNLLRDVEKSVALY